jgi:dUTP pyrophosphatase
MSKQVKINVDEAFDFPKYATKGSAGADLSSSSPHNIIINPGERAAIPLGIYAQVPRGYAAFALPRSGLVLKHGVTVANAPGLIDSDYRGEWKVILINHGKEPFKVRLGDRIAQVVIQRVTRARWIEVLRNMLTKTIRGAGGFGSTGK